jgi:hypothetical protein
MLKGGVDDLDLLGRRHSVDGAAPVGTVGRRVGPPGLAMDLWWWCGLAHAGTAELERLEPNLGFGDRDAVSCGLDREGQFCRSLAGHNGQAEQCRKGPPHGES